MKDLLNFMLLKTDHKWLAVCAWIWVAITATWTVGIITFLNGDL